jgi:hypothetical protein
MIEWPTSSADEVRTIYFDRECCVKTNNDDEVLSLLTPNPARGPNLDSHAFEHQINVSNGLDPNVYIYEATER